MMTCQAHFAVPSGAGDNAIDLASAQTGHWPLD